MAKRELEINVNLADLKTSTKDIATSLDRLSKKLDELGQKITQFGNKGKAASERVKKGTKEQRDEMAKLKAEIRRTERDFVGSEKKKAKALDALKVKYDKLAVAMQKTGKVAQTSANKAAAAQKGFNNQVSLGRQLMLRLRSVMLTVFGAYAIIQGIRNTINAVKDFELATARLAAITGKTKEELEDLTNISKALATEGIFNAEEITNMQVQLAKFGFTINEIASSTRGILDLATATGEDLENATTLVSSAIRALGLEAEETARLVDVLGKSFTSSALDVNKFRESAKFFLPIARQLGWTIEEVTATLGKLADSGLSGSLAGTGLRQVFIQLLDSSSSLSAILGQGINTFEEFYDALDNAKDSGIAFNEVFNATPVRARSLLTVIWNSTDAIREYKEELDDANGSISEMANVQMDTLAYQIERTDAAFKALVVSVQDGGGIMKDTLEGVADTLRGIAMALNPQAFGVIEATKAIEKFRSTLKFVDRENVLGRIEYRIGQVSDEMSDASDEVDRLENQYKKLGLSVTRFTPVGAIFWLDYTSSIGEARAKLAKLTEEHRLLEELLDETKIEHFLDKYISGLETSSTLGLAEIKKEILDGGITQEEYDRYKNTYQKYLDEIDMLAVDALVRHDETSAAFFATAFDRLKKYGEKELALLAGDLSTYLMLLAEAQENALKNQKTLLSLQERLEVMRAKNQIESAEDLEIRLLEIKIKYAKLNLELDISSGKLTVEQAKVAKDIILELEKTLGRERTEIREKWAEKYKDIFEAEFEEQLKLMKTNHEIELQELKNNGATKEELWEAEMKYLIQIAELRLQLNQLLGNDTRQLMADLQLLRAEFAGGFQETDKTIDNTKKIAQAYKKLANEVIDALESMADAQVENTSRLVDDLDTRIAETQRALETETQLYIEGYANNVTLKKKELSDLKEARDQAIVDREKAVRRQQQLEAIAQAIDLASAVANTIKIYSPIPGVGLAIAAVVAGGFLALFSAMQAKAKTISQYAEGGEIEGDSHARGGVLIEAEGGEFVMRKSAYAKYPELVRAINEDNLPEFNASVMNNIGGGSDVIIDNEIWHKMYSLWDKNLNKGKVEIVGKKKIVTRGIRKRTINV